MGSVCVEGGIIKNAERDLLNVNYVVIASTCAKTCNLAQLRKKSPAHQEIVLISPLPFVTGNLPCFTYRRFPHASQYSSKSFPNTFTLFLLPIIKSSLCQSALEVQLNPFSPHSPSSSISQVSLLSICWTSVAPCPICAVHHADISSLCRHGGSRKPEGQLSSS